MLTDVQTPFLGTLLAPLKCGWKHSSYGGGAMRRGSGGRSGRLSQEGTGSVRFVSVPDFSKIHRFGSVRFGKSCFPVRRGTACVFRTRRGSGWSGSVRFGFGSAGSIRFLIPSCYVRRLSPRTRACCEGREQLTSELKRGEEGGSRRASMPSCR